MESGSGWRKQNLLGGMGLGLAPMGMLEPMRRPGIYTQGGLDSGVVLEVKWWLQQLYCLRLSMCRQSRVWEKVWHQDLRRYIYGSSSHTYSLSLSLPLPYPLPSFTPPTCPPSCLVLESHWFLLVSHVNHDPSCYELAISGMSLSLLPYKK
jgi:hypothetical protein